MPHQPRPAVRRLRATTTAVLGAGLVLSGAVAPASGAPLPAVLTEVDTTQIATPMTNGYSEVLSEAADLDADGDVDLVTAIYEQGLVVQLNQGDGTFAAPTQVTNTGQRAWLDTGDLDGDGYPEVLGTSASGQLFVYDGSATGPLAPRVVPGVSATGAVATGDVDGDGVLDVVVGAFQAAVAYRGDGSGGLTAASAGTVASSWGFSALRLADVGGDGLADLVGFSQIGELVVAQGTADGGFGPATSAAYQAMLLSFSVGDVDGDSDLDVVFGSLANTQGMFYVANAGDGTFGGRVAVQSGGGYHGAALADLNLDGTLDIASVLRAGGGAYTLDTFLGSGTGAFTLSRVGPHGQATEVLAADLVGDSRPDLRTVSVMDRVSHLLLNTAAEVPVVTAAPVSEQVVLGGTATLSVSGTGNPAPTVRWQRHNGSFWSSISGATAATYTTPPITAANDGWGYRAVLTNAAGTATSDPAYVTHLPLPVVTSQPVGTTVTAGTPLTLSAAADGDTAVRWETSLGGEPWTPVGDGTEILELAPAFADDGRAYRAVFANASGEVTSSEALLGVLADGATVTDHPLDQVVTTGGTATFTAAATGDPTPTLQWEISTDGGGTFVPVAGATDLALQLPTTYAMDGSLLRAAFTNPAGTVTSDPAALTVLASGPVVTLQPQDAAVATGQPVSFTAAATGDPVPAVQWQVSAGEYEPFTDLPGETATTLQLVPTGTSDGLRYRAVFTTTAGADLLTATSDPAELDVTWVPAAPAQDVRAAQTGPGQITVTWSASPGGGSNPVTGYAVGYGGGSWGNGTEVAADVTSAVFDGLAEGDYTAVVLPVTADGVELESREVRPVTVGPWVPSLPGATPGPTTGWSLGGPAPQAAPVRTGANADDDADGDDGRLADTGSEPAGLLALAGFAWALGGLALVVSRRSARRTAG